MSTAYERLVQVRRTFGTKVEETIQSKENVENLSSMVLEDLPKTSLWDDGGSFKDIASDEEADDEQADADQQRAIDSSLAVEHAMQKETNDYAEENPPSEMKESDYDGEIPTDDLSSNDKESKHDDVQEDNEDEEEHANDDSIPAITRASEKSSSSPMTMSPPAGTKDNTSKEQENDDNFVHEEPQSLESILDATNKLFDQVEDKGTVTVKQILQRLGVPLDKPTKKAVRQRLVELITAWQRQQQDQDDESSKNSSDEEEEEEDAMEEEEVIGDADDEYEPDALKPSVSRARRTRGLASERPRRKKLNKSLQKSALRIQAEQLRKKRMQELRVRNEELQYESKDQERAEQIAAKFETQTDDQLRERLSKRVNLWQKLDKKRWNVLQAQPNIKLESTETAETIKLETVTAEEDEKEVVKEVDSSTDSDSDDDLEIIGETKTLMVAQSSPKPARKDVLSLLELSSPKLADHRKEPTISPNRTLATLKRQLRSKHQKMGNLWLAQELGYKTEQEHIQDCVQFEERKRLLQLAREQERLKESELRQERLLQLGVEYEDEEERINQPESENHNENDDGEKSENEDDEEIAMAREMGAIESDAVDENNGQLHANDDADTEAESVPLENSNEIPGDTDLVPPTDVVSKNSSTQAEVGGDEMKSDIIPESHVKSNVVAITDQDSAAIPLGDDETNADNETEQLGDSNEEGETEMEIEAPESEKPKGPRNAAWKAMLQREEEKLKKLKKRGKGGLVEEEAEEEEEEEVAGLEDFGFKIHKKKNDDDDDEENLPDGDEEMDDVVDELSDNEGDEDAGEKARREQQKREEKERHKEILRRMRDGYDGRRGGIAGGSARGIHRFDQLVAADNREDAKRLGLLNDDELDSEDEAEKKDSDDEEEDENALLDKMLKDRFLHRSSVEVEEDFSGDEEDENNDLGEGDDDNKQTEEEREQEKLAKRFSKRARMQRLIDAHGHDEEFSRSKLIDDDEMIKADLQKMKVRCQHLVISRMTLF